MYVGEVVLLESGRHVRVIGGASFHKGVLGRRHGGVNKDTPLVLVSAPFVYVECDSLGRKRHGARTETDILSTQSTAWTPEGGYRDVFPPERTIRSAPLSMYQDGFGF